MTIAEIAPLLKATIYNGPAGFEATAVQHIVASDLMSDVLVSHTENFILITSLASDQMIRTADLVGAAAVILVNGKQPPASLTRLAQDLAMPLLGTALPKFEACLAVGQALLQDATP
jgi:predicted transcriptional regulator